MRARALLIVAAIAAALAAGGACTKHQTEVVLEVDTAGVRIPDDVRTLHISVQDRTPAGDQEVWMQDVAICNPQLSSTCYDLPVTAVLYPGPQRGSDTVRVEVDAVGANGPVIQDAALFTFADEQSLYLKIVLYANCIGTECAKRDQACGPLGNCIDVEPSPTNGPVDLALSPADMAGCGKLNQPCCHNGARASRVHPSFVPDGGLATPDMAIDVLDMTMPVNVPLDMFAPLDFATGGDVGTCDPGLTCTPTDICQ